MFPRKTALAICFLAMMAAPAVFAQIGAAAAIALEQDDAGIVTGEPLFAIEKVVDVTPLADGTTLTKLAEVRKWRDSQGRFRRQSAPFKEGEEPVFDTVTIIDPVANTVTVLHMDQKGANVFHLPQKGQWSLHPYTDPFDKPILARPGVNVKLEKLEEKQIAGVNAIGRRETRTRPPGTIGNDKPVVSVSERWISPDLKIMLQTTMNDPREQQMRQVLELDRSEPAPSLFAIPSGFAVKEIDVKEPQR